MVAFDVNANEISFTNGNVDYAKGTTRWWLSIWST